MEVIQMHVVLWAIGALVALVALLYLFLLGDFVTSRKGMMPSGVAFTREELSSGGGRRVLVVYLPGILSRSEDTLPFLRYAFAGAASGRSLDLLMVDYVGDRFNAEHVASRIHARVSEEQGVYDQIVFIGASLGGRLLNLVYQWIWKDDELHAKASSPIILDAPMSHRQFAGGGNLFTVVLRIVPIGRLVNMLRLIDRSPGPKDENIGNAGVGAEFSQITGGQARTYTEYIKWVRRQAHEGLGGHATSMWRDQLVSMSRMHWCEEAFEGHKPLYIGCGDTESANLMGLHADLWPYGRFVEDVLPGATNSQGELPLELPRNTTVKQPDARIAWLDRVPGLRYWAVASTHCGYYERPVAWRKALSAALSEVLRLQV